jgi:alpha-mannosidase
MKTNVMKTKRISYFALLAFFLTVSSPGKSQQAWFVDGYHGGIYGHYPMWQAKFMVEKLQEYPGWKINLEIEPETWDTVSVKDPVNFKNFQDYYADTGRFGRIEFVNPAYAQPYCYNISGESIIRQFTYGMAKIKNYFPQATFSTYSVEEPCFTSSLPQVLKGLGYSYAVSRNPNTCWGGYTTAFGKDLVNWIGPDGTSIPTVPRYECEWLVKESTWQTASWNNSKEFIEACFEDGIRYPVGMCFQDAGWDGGPWLGNAVKDFYEPTEYAVWTDYINMIEDRVEATDWKFSQEDVKPGLVWGSQVLQKIAQEVRVSENKLVMAEKIAAMDALFYGTDFPVPEFAEAWRTLMLAQHHDCWIVPYNGRPGNTWADKVTRWTNSSNYYADSIVNHIFYANSSAGDDAKTIRVYNTLGQPRSDIVSIVLPESCDEPPIVSDNKKKRVPAQVSADQDGRKILQFMADLSGMGYKDYSIMFSKENKKSVVSEINVEGLLKIETNYYKVVIDPARGGVITSLVDKKNGMRELVEKDGGLNEIRGYFYRDKTFQSGSDEPAVVSICEDGDLYTRIRIENKLSGHPYLQYISLSKVSPRIDFELIINWEGQPGIGAYDDSRSFRAENYQKAFYNDRYKLHLAFPFRDIGDHLYKNAPFDVCESQLENTFYSRYDSIKHNVILNWVDVSDKANDYGVALFTDHTTSYLHSEDLPLGLTVQYAGKGLWGRNYRIHGPTHISYSLLPHAGNWNDAGVEYMSQAWNEKLIGKMIRSDHPGSERILVESKDRGLLVSAGKMDDEGLSIRVYNSSSTSKEYQLHWHCNAEEIYSTDLNGNILDALEMKNDKEGNLLTEIELPPFGFKTIKLNGIHAD